MSISFFLSFDLLSFKVEIILIKLCVVIRERFWHRGNKTFIMLNPEQLFCNGAISLCVSRPQGYKTLFMLNSAEHGILIAYEC